MIMIPPVSLLEILCAPVVLGAAGVSLYGRARATPVPGLLFHSIGQEHLFTLSVLSEPRFRNLVSALHRSGCVSVTLAQAASGLPLAAGSRRPVLATFDDGCRSFYTSALPLLEELRFKATLFPVAGYLGKRSTWDVLPAFLHCSASEIREIASLGHEIGSHSVSHSNLTYLDLKELRTELAESKRILEDVTGKPVESLSFPFGSWNKRVWEIAREEGYTRGTLYRRHSRALPGLFPVYGVYRFDTPESVLRRMFPAGLFSVSVALARLMTHFAKGASLWKFRESYRLLR